MANREQRGNKEKKKPKADKNKDQKHQPFGGHTPMGQFGQMPQVGVTAFTRRKDRRNDATLAWSPT